MNYKNKSTLQKSGLSWLVRTLFFSVLVCCFSVQAKFTPNNYITENLTTPLYKKADSQSPIIYNIPSGSPIQVMRTKDSGWSQIRLANNRRGWILSFVISSDYGSKEKIKRLTHQLNQLQREASRQQKVNSYLNEQMNVLTQKNNKLLQKNFKLDNQLQKFSELVKRPARVYKDNQYLRQQLEFIKYDNAFLKKSTKDTAKRNSNNWLTLLFIAIIAGILLGVMINGFRTKHRQKAWRTI